MRTLLIFSLLLASCATPSAGGPIPPAAPRFEHDAPVPPFVERVAQSHAERVRERASVWRPPDTLIVAVVADMNPSYGKTVYGPQVPAAAEWITQDLRPDLVLSAGDMVAGQKKGLDYLAMWDAFDGVFAVPLADAGYPLYVTPGNHDGAAGPAFATERATYRRVWEDRAPRNDLLAGSNWPFYYAFIERGVLFVGLDATTVGPLDASQRDWLRETLASNSETRASVLFGHVPPLPFAIGREWEVLADSELEEIIATYGVDAVITGHHHAYFPGRRGDTLYIGAASLGSGPRPLIGRDYRSPRGVTVLTILGDGRFHVEAHVAPTYDTIVDHQSLPEIINHHGRWLLREDVERERAARE